MPLLDLRLAIQGDLRKIVAADQAAIERGTTAGVRLGTDRLKQALRAQITGAGLGQRLANTIRSANYPQRGTSMEAAGSVFTRQSGHIVRGYDEGSLIRPGSGKTYLAIPTKNVPRRQRGGSFGGRGLWANPFEVETKFNQDLKFFRARNGTVVAYINAVASKSKRGWRSVTKGRVRQGRQIQRVVMFILVPQVRLRKRIDVDAAYRSAADGIATLVAREIDRELARDQSH